MSWNNIHYGAGGQEGGFQEGGGEDEGDQDHTFSDHYSSSSTGVMTLYQDSNLSQRQDILQEKGRENRRLLHLVMPPFFPEWSHCSVTT